MRGVFFLLFLWSSAVGVLPAQVCGWLTCNGVEPSGFGPTAIAQGLPAILDAWSADAVVDCWSISSRAQDRIRQIHPGAPISHSLKIARCEGVSFAQGPVADQHLLRPVYATVTVRTEPQLASVDDSTLPMRGPDIKWDNRTFALTNMCDSMLVSKHARC